MRVKIRTTKCDRYTLSDINVALHNIHQIERGLNASFFYFGEVEATLVVALNKRVSTKLTPTIVDA